MGIMQKVAALLHGTPLDLRERLSHGALLVDVRSENEYRAGHLDCALLIPHDQIEARITELGTDKAREIILYCRSGGRASAAAGILKRHGFSNVSNAGGYQGLKRSLEKSAQA
jgi:phage shock protein E